MEKNTTKITEIDVDIWMPAASHYGNILNSSKTRYAIFGTGALAVQNIMNRSTVDIDFVVDDYNDAVSIMKEQPNIKSVNLQKERDGIQMPNDWHLRENRLKPDDPNPFRAVQRLLFARY